MTETEIQKLFAYQYGLLNNNLVLPNITMKGSEGGNYEADLIYINKRRYVSEVEIKISISDFRADFKKKIYHNSDIVRQFYYLFPDDLYRENGEEIERLIMESDAGIMTVRNFRGRCVKIRRKATIRRSVEPIKETKLLELMYIAGQSAMKKLRAEMKACSDRDLLEEYLDYQNRENKRIESIWGEW